VRARVGDAGSVAALGEVQLNTNADTFEDELVGLAPQGFVLLPVGTPMVVVASGGWGWKVIERYTCTTPLRRVSR
jgi:hypothetical protein